MPDIDYQAIADELRKGWIAPMRSMPPGDYLEALMIQEVARAIEAVGLKQKQ